MGSRGVQDTVTKLTKLAGWIHLLLGRSVEVTIHVFLFFTSINQDLSRPTNFQNYSGMSYKISQNVKPLKKFGMQNTFQIVIKCTLLKRANFVNVI